MGKKVAIIAHHRAGMGAAIARLIYSSMDKDFERREVIDGFETSNSVAPNTTPAPHRTDMKE